LSIASTTPEADDLAPAPEAAGLQAAEAAGAEAWSLTRRIAFRFASSYLILFLFPFPFDAIPGLDALAERYNQLWTAFAPWLEVHVLGLRQAVPVEPTGSGDAMFNYVQNLCILALAVVATLVWTLLDRRRHDYRWLLHWVRVYVRYALAVILLSYGMNKVIKLQFPFPSLDRMLQPFGTMSPMGLLWRFMGFSKPYTFFAGAMEVLGGMLLFFRRTTTLGALVVISVMTNVVMLNFSYDVPVKLYSMNLLLMAVFLLAPDLRRVADVLLFNRPAAPANLASPLTARWAKIGALAVKVIFIGFILLLFTKLDLEGEKVYGEKAPRSPLYGIYEVDELIRNGQIVPPLITDASRWRNVVMGRKSSFTVKLMDDTVMHYSVKYDTANRRMTLSTFAPKAPSYLWVYARPDKDHLVLQGRFLKDALTVKLRRIDESKFLLVSRGFHWISEVPLNR
jgi:uncharacterized membrane protein YphA (DoxX/SURF4 family)